MSRTQVSLIYNPCAGRLRGRRAYRVAQVVAALEAEGYEVRATPTPGPGTAGELARQAIEAGTGAVLALGGDGTLNEVAAGMIGSRTPLAMIPAGTANVLAREIGFGCNMLKAVRKLPDCEPRRIAVGRLHADGGATTRTFLLMAGVGFDAHIVYNLNLPLKSKLGQVAYWVSAMKQIGRNLDEFEVRTGEGAFTCSFALASRVRNYAGYLEIASGAKLLGDDFEVVLFEGRSTLRHYARYLVSVILGRASVQKGITYTRSRSASFSAPAGSPVYVQVDGEYAGRLPARVEVVPDALTLLVPRGFA